MVSDHIGQQLQPHPLQGLLTPGERLGWQYEPGAPQPFPHRQPDMPPPVQPVVDTAAAGKAMRRRLLLAIGIGAGLTLLLGCCGFAANGPHSTTEFGSTLTYTAVLLGLGTIGLVVWIAVGHRRATARAAGVSGAPYRAYQQALQQWQRAAAAHDAAEAVRVAALPQWRATGPRPGVTRLDVIGGSQWGWEALLTVAGAGYLATHGPSTIVDLTGDALCRELHGFSVASGIPVDLQVPPGDCELLTGLTAQDLVETLVEAIHGDGDRAVRADRATDERILSALADSLGDDVSVARLVDGLRVLLRAPGSGATLTPAERQHIADDLFTADSRSHLTGALHRLEAYLYPLRNLTTATRPAAALTILAAGNNGISAQSELLNDLIVAWVTRRIASHPELCRTLLIAGADHLPERHVERLAGICTRRGIRLVLLWQHLRDTAQRALGSGTVAFMRLGSAEEATRAADYIGRQHTFVLSSLTQTTGGSTTVTESTGTSDAVTTGSTRGTTYSGAMHSLLRTAQAWSRSDQATTGTTRSTSTGTATATGSNWSDAATRQRVYEYAVEPTVLQGLPEYALLLVDHAPTGTDVRALDCNPAIVTLPRVDMTTRSTTARAGAVPPAAVTADPAAARWDTTAPGGGYRVPVQRAESWSDPGQDW